MRRIEVTGPDGGRTLVLRSFVKPFFVRHAEGLLGREAAILGLLGPGEVPAARLIAVDERAERCEHPSLLMTLLPGTIRLDGADAARQAALMARQLLAIHRTETTDLTRPRDYQAWTAPERVAVPPATSRPGLWARAVALIDRPAPAHRPLFLHRDYHPGNVLLTGHGPALRISGVVDWVETSWGPADLDVAHCATALALLHGPAHGTAFADHYTAAAWARSPTTPATTCTGGCSTRSPSRRTPRRSRCPGGRAAAPTSPLAARRAAGDVHRGPPGAVRPVVRRRHRDPGAGRTGARRRMTPCSN